MKLIMNLKIQEQEKNFMMSSLFDEVLMKFIKNLTEQ